MMVRDEILDILYWITHSLRLRYNVTSSNQTFLLVYTFLGLCSIVL